MCKLCEISKPTYRFEECAVLKMDIPSPTIKPIHTNSYHLNVENKKMSEHSTFFKYLKGIRSGFESLFERFTPLRSIYDLLHLEPINKDYHFHYNNIDHNITPMPSLIKRYFSKTLPVDEIRPITIIGNNSESFHLKTSMNSEISNRPTRSRISNIFSYTTKASSVSIFEMQNPFKILLSSERQCNLKIDQNFKEEKYTNMDCNHVKLTNKFDKNTSTMVQTKNCQNFKAAKCISSECFNGQEDSINKQDFSQNTQHVLLQRKKWKKGRPSSKKQRKRKREKSRLSEGISQNRSNINIQHTANHVSDFSIADSNLHSSQIAAAVFIVGCGDLSSDEHDSDFDEYEDNWSDDSESDNASTNEELMNMFAPRLYESRPSDNQPQPPHENHPLELKPNVNNFIACFSFKPDCSGPSSDQDDSAEEDDWLDDDWDDGYDNSSSNINNIMCRVEDVDFEVLNKKKNLQAINAKWEKEYCFEDGFDDASSRTSKVYFDETVTIYEVESFKTYFVDRERFKHRIDQFEQIISPILNNTHRRNIYERNKMTD